MIAPFPIKPLNIVEARIGWPAIVPTVLRQRCSEVDLSSPEAVAALPLIVHELFLALYQSVGLGIAAPQLGVTWRLAVIDTGVIHEPALATQLVLINPEFVSVSEEQSDKIEGCLSLRGYQGNVCRPESITIKNYAIDGESHIIQADGILARVIQHEMDHLDGIVYWSPPRCDSPELDEEGGLTRVTRRRTASIPYLHEQSS